MTRSRNPLERLAALAKLYRQFLELTREILQKDSFDEENTIDTLFDRRNKILNKIKKLEQGLETKRQNDQNLLVNVSASDEEEASNLLMEIQKLITELIPSDRKLKKKLEKELSLTGRQLKRIKQGQKFLKNYAPYKNQISYYINRKS
ncbi:MAG: hypothetical protein JRI34_01015 [Deltaproteobacteria bacterium]|nr:hypothetical protein [Deltaproteobacteria bacterium]